LLALVPTAMQANTASALLDFRLASIIVSFLASC
jgi:hypothetical protein